MTYLSKELSQLCAERGLKPGGDSLWIKNRNDAPKVWNFTQITHYMDRNVKIISPAFCLEDILCNKENAKKIWGGDLVDEYQGVTIEEAKKEIEEAHRKQNFSSKMIPTPLFGDFDKIRWEFYIEKLFWEILNKEDWESTLYQSLKGTV